MNQKVQLRLQVPIELSTAVQEKAVRDADVVYRFLTWLGRKWAGDSFDLAAIDLPPGFMSALAAALQLVAWEQRGVFIHRDIGLPSADDAVLLIFRSYQESDTHPACAHLQHEVFQLFVQRFAWAGRSDLDADIVLDDLEEDVLVDALADFLWARRAH